MMQVMGDKLGFSFFSNFLVICFLIMKHILTIIWDHRNYALEVLSNGHNILVDSIY